MGDVAPTLYNVHTKTYVQINNTVFSIGRGVNCNHVLTCIGVSRQHCILKKQGQKWTLFDKSMNGTRVNGVLIKANDFVDLKSGDLIWFAPDIEYIFMENQQEVVTVENMPKDLVVVDSTLENAGPDEDEVIAVRVEGAGAGESTTDHKPEEEDGKEKEKPTACEATASSKEEVSAAITSNAMEDELTCSICSELFVKAVTLTCSHTYCNLCITEWRKSKSICPICRAPITAMSPTLVLDNYIAKIIESQSEEVRNARTELVKQRTQPSGGVGGPGPSTSSVAGPSSSTTSAISITSTGIIEISEEEDLDEEEDMDDDDDDYHHRRYDFYDSFEDYDEEDDDDASDVEYNGRPGVYYGGYGRCYTCGQRGHWANGCPLKRRNRRNRNTTAPSSTSSPPRSNSLSPTSSPTPSNPPSHHLPYPCQPPLNYSFPHPPPNLSYPAYPLAYPYMNPVTHPQTYTPTYHTTCAPTYPHTTANYTYPPTYPPQFPPNLPPYNYYPHYPPNCALNYSPHYPPNYPHTYPPQK